MNADVAGLRMVVTFDDGMVRLTLGSLTLSLQPAEAEKLGWALLDAPHRRCGHCGQVGPAWHDWTGGRRCKNCDWRVDLG